MYYFKLYSCALYEHADDRVARLIHLPESRMSNTLKLIERVRSTTERGTDYAVAKALRMPQSYLIEVKKGRRWPGQASQIAIAELLKMDLKDVMALVNEDKAKTPGEREYWRGLLSARIREAFNTAGKTAAAWLVAAMILTSGYPGKAEAGVRGEMLTNLYIMRTLRRWLRGATDAPTPAAA